MKKFSVFFFVFAFLPHLLPAQSGNADYSSNTESLYRFSKSITQNFLRKHLSVIASDSMMGRDTGTPGLKKAAAYLASFYQSHGIPPKGVDSTYFQPFDLHATVTDSTVFNTYRVGETDTVQVNRSVEANHSMSDYLRGFGGDVPIAGDIVFAGFGVNDSLRNVQNLEGESLANKWALVFEDIPNVVGGDTLIDPNISARSRFVTLIRDYGVRGILVISDHSEAEFNELAEINEKMVSIPENLRLAYLDSTQQRSGYTFGYNQISPGLAAEILGTDGSDGLQNLKDSLVQNLSDFRAQNTGYYLKYTPYIRQQTIQTKNVLAYMEGSDPKLKDEVVVLMAHYDHLGIGSPNESGDYIYNGADDNGSGTTGLLAIANALNEAKKAGYEPKRSILFLHVAGEESGLLGSRYYSDHPIIPIENTVANLNTDMIGRSDPEHIRAGNRNYVYLIGGEIISSELDSLVSLANEKSVHLELDRKYNDLDDSNQFYRRSDHWNFGRLSVPFVFFFTGVHKDYHQPSDEVEKIDFDKYTKVVRLIYTSTIAVANYDGRPKVDNQKFIEITN